ncbi:MAG TPA: hypothetical protein VG097_10715 [Gemmata sp.]|jgi:hypothetical protein|nr:hypothetical protein [Gemmata sp.]
MTVAHRIEAVLSEDGKLSLDQLPFRAGQLVEVIVLPAAGPIPISQSLKGTVIHYDQPTAPVADADWGALR